ncbi:MAG: hypothetical protein JWN56_1009 [Sphingobacteriales bacterium]|nr:hypothetical protein [Daejeonella sp.]MDB5119791.1 hypothetical protein [Sphingobacteriales bacterium]
MKTSSLVKDYSKLSDANLNLKAQSIILALTANPNFSATAPTLAVFTSIKNTYSTTLANAASRDRNAIAQKKAAKSALVLNMRLLGSNLESLALGDRVKLISSGFDLSSLGESVPALAIPTGFTLSDGINAGEVKFSMKAVREAVAYVFEYTTDTVITKESRWITKVSTSREYVFSNLPSGVRITCRMGAIGRKDQEVFTGMLTRVVQ